jgi:AcrR family transcriptional regulator
MPRVSAEHSAARRQQILDGAFRAFSRSGFHRTTMQDVVRESGLSAGAVYTYFRSKDEIVNAAGDLLQSELVGALEELLAQPDPAPSPADAVEHLLHHVASFGFRPDGTDLTRIAVTVWAEALRDENLLGVVRRPYGRIRDLMTELAARRRDAGLLPADADPAAVGAALFSLLPGFLMQRLLLGGVDVDGYAAGVRALLGDQR